MTWLLVALGGALGGMARALIDWRLRPDDPAEPPVGILVCNGVGSLLLGFFAVVFIYGPDVSPWFDLLGTGVCGALTTWSAFCLDSIRLYQHGRTKPAVLYFFGSLLVGVLAAAIGVGIGNLVV